jgi:hypothetical protein
MLPLHLNSSLTRTQVLTICLAALMFVVMVILGSIFLPSGIDWHYVFRPASLRTLSGKSPYDVPSFFSAPWGLLPLLPFAVLPENVGRAAAFVLGIAVFAFTAYRMGAKPVGMIAFLVSPPVLHCLLNSNIDWLPLLGFVLPPRIGLFLLAVKPQVGFGVALFWLVEEWRKGGLRQVFHTFWPISAALLVSFGVFGFWPVKFRTAYDISEHFNASLWPLTIPVGLALLVAAIRRRNARPAMAAAPCLSPYVLLHAWSGVLISFVSESAELVAAVVGLWIIVAISALSGGL